MEEEDFLDENFVEIKKKYSNRVQERHNELIEEIENCENWKFQKKNSRVNLFRMKWSETGVNIFKAISFFSKVNVEDVFRHFYCKGGDYEGGEYIRVREPYLVKFRYVHIYDATECITEQTCGYGILFSNREFVVYQTQRFKDNLITLVGESIENEDADKICGKNRIRGNFFFGHILRQVEEDVQSVIFTYTEPGIPVFLYNPGAQKSAFDTANNFVKQFEEDFEKKRIK